MSKHTAHVEELFTYLNTIIEKFALQKCDCLNCLNCKHKNDEGENGGNGSCSCLSCQNVQGIENMSMQELNAISIIGSEGPCIMRKIADKMRLAVSTITTIVDKLEAKGLVIRERSEEDRRIVKVSLTEKGQLVYQADLDSHLELSQAMLSTLNEDEQEILIVLLRKISRNLSF